jgi:hypothetical protein
VFERPLRYLSITLTLIVAVGFTLFALDDFDRASDSSVNRIAGYTATDPTPSGERERERRHSTARELIDDANDVLLRPFAALTANDDSRWMRRGIPALLGLLVYGFLLAYFARYAKGHG